MIKSGCCLPLTIFLNINFLCATTISSVVQLVEKEKKNKEKQFLKSEKREKGKKRTNPKTVSHCGNTIFGLSFFKA